MIWVVGDWHFYHNREFVYKSRGFETIDQMNQTIIYNHNLLVQPNDDVYVLGDLLLGGANSAEKGLELISQMKGKLHLVRGNHDTDSRWTAYSLLDNVVEQQNAIYLKYKKYHFYLSHYPTFTSNLEKESLHQCTINLFAHTHQSDNKFYNDIPFMYCCCLDCHDNKPVLLDEAIEDMKTKVQECYNEL